MSHFKKKVLISWYERDKLSSGQTSATWRAAARHQRRKCTSLPPHTLQSVFQKHPQLATPSRILRGDQPLMTPATCTLVFAARGLRFPLFSSSSWTDRQVEAVLGSSATVWENFSKCVLWKSQEIAQRIFIKLEKTFTAKRRPEDLKIKLNPRNNWQN